VAAAARWACVDGQGATSAPRCDWIMRRRWPARRALFVVAPLVCGGGRQRMQRVILAPPRRPARWHRISTRACRDGAGEDEQVARCRINSPDRAPLSAGGGGQGATDNGLTLTRAISLVSVSRHSCASGVTDSLSRLTAGPAFGQRRRWWHRLGLGARRSCFGGSGGVTSESTQICNTSLAGPPSHHASPRGRAPANRKRTLANDDEFQRD
jgi:hypothetical protein